MADLMDADRVKEAQSARATKLEQGRQRATASYKRVRNDPARWAAHLERKRVRRERNPDIEKRKTARKKKRRQEDPAYRAAVNSRASKWAYGVSAAEIEEIRISLQDGVCAVCRRPDGPWCVDHDHETGALRGILCARCNMAIGALRDNAKICRRAAAYLDSPPIQGHPAWSKRRGRRTGRRRAQP